MEHPGLFETLVKEGGGGGIVALSLSAVERWSGERRGRGEGRRMVCSMPIMRRESVLS